MTVENITQVIQDIFDENTLNKQETKEGTFVITKILDSEYPDEIVLETTEGKIRLTVELL